MLRESLADYAHDAWSGWMQYLFDKSRRNPDGSVTIPPDLVTRWKRQMLTDYADLSANEQASDLAEADKMLTLFQAARAEWEGDDPDDEVGELEHDPDCPCELCQEARIETAVLFDMGELP